MREEPGPSHWPSRGISECPRAITVMVKMALKKAIGFFNGEGSGLAHHLSLHGTARSGKRRRDDVG